MGVAGSLSGLLTGSCSTSSYTAQTHLPQDSAPQDGLSLPTSIINQETSPKSWAQSNLIQAACEQGIPQMTLGPVWLTKYVPLINRLINFAVYRKELSTFLHPLQEAQRPHFLVHNVYPCWLLQQVSSIYNHGKHCLSQTFKCFFGSILICFVMPCLTQIIQNNQS